MRRLLGFAALVFAFDARGWGGTRAVLALLVIGALPASSPAEIATLTGLFSHPTSGVFDVLSVSGDGAVGLAEPAAALPSFTGLGFLPDGCVDSRAYGVSSDGSVVVGSCASASFESGERAFRWTASSGMVDLATLPDAIHSSAYGVSADGSVVVGQSFALGTGGVFRWTAAEGMVDLGHLPPETWGGRANGVSADGSVVVGTSGAPAFRWTAESGMVGLGSLPGGHIVTATGVSADGSVVVGWAASPLPTEAYRWTSDGGMVGLGFLPGARVSYALGVSADGSVIVGGSGNQAFRWTAAEGMVGLEYLPGLDTSSAYATSADGSITVGTIGVNLTPIRAAAIWDAHGVRSLQDVLTNDGLDLTGWTLKHAYGVSADGRAIVGFGTNPDGQTEAWLAVIPVAQCSDGIDNDGDGFVDYPADTGCSDTYDPSEQSAALACDDGIDNDGDGLVDMTDPGCPFPYATIENPQCDDGIDNDGNGFTDFADTKCESEWPYWETPPPCGLGVELVLVLPLLSLAASRRRRAN